MTTRRALRQALALGSPYLETKYQEIEAAAAEDVRAGLLVRGRRLERVVSRMDSAVLVAEQALRKQLHA